MIAKISPPSKDLMKTLTYNFRKVDRDQADILLSEQLSADGRLTAERVFREMTAYIPSGTRTKNIVFHASINPRPDELLSDDRLRTIAREYLRRLGYICDDIDVFSLGGPLQSRPVKRDGGIGIDARTLMGYYVCYIMRIKHSVDVDLGPTAHGGLL